MKIMDWPKDEVAREAAGSGKPLEVACAQAFIAKGWQARLGSYYEDPAKGARELDALVLKEETIQAPAPLVCRLRVLASCRGFPPDTSPLTYSVSAGTAQTFAPKLFARYHAMQPIPPKQTAYGPIDEIEESGARHLLRLSHLEKSRPVVALAQLNRSEMTKGKGKQASKKVGYKIQGDKELFSAIDSCVKATLYWTGGNMEHLGGITYYASLNVPVCILLHPFWDVCIDGGQVSSAQIVYRGYQTSSIPVLLDHSTQREITTLFWHADQLDDLVQVLDELFLWFKAEIEKSQYYLRWST